MGTNSRAVRIQSLRAGPHLLKGQAHSCRIIGSGVGAGSSTLWKEMQEISEPEDCFSLVRAS
jgi:hypothetical protein